ncbi:MAG: L-threonylcarbamoyladenylate synthase [Thermodesulfobacteriota bacterium]
MASSLSPSDAEYNVALEALRQGNIVAYPTETFYGLAVDPRNQRAVASLYGLKKREAEKPLSLIVPDLATLSACVSSTPLPYKNLIHRFWPGPLTLIFPAKEEMFSRLSGGDGTLAIRISSHPVAQKLCSLWGGPLTATSANISGEAALTSGEQIRRLWGDHISSLLDGGTVPGGLGSTIVRCDDDNICYLLRHGVIPAEEIAQSLPDHSSLSPSRF